jgi:hypothetical protein
MVKNGHEVAVIEYHNGDGYVNQAATDRISYYNVSGFPTTEVDGVLEMVGGNATTSLYPAFLNMYNQRKPVPSVQIMDKKIEHVSGDLYRATVTLEQANAYFPSDLVLHTALTESHIPENWLGGLHEVNFVCRDMYPNAQGTALNFSSSNTLTFTFDFPVTGYVFENLEFIEFVQHNPTKEVVQSVSHQMLYTGISENPKLALTVYPNPAIEFITLQANSQKPISYTITNILGRTMVSMRPVTSELTKIDVSKWASGVYIVKTDDGFSRKITVANR